MSCYVVFETVASVWGKLGKGAWVANFRSDCVWDLYIWLWDRRPLLHLYSVHLSRLLGIFVCITSHASHSMGGTPGYRPLPFP